MKYISAKILIKGANNNILALIHNHEMYKLYASEEMIYFWAIDNSRFMMKRFKFTAVRTYAGRGKCSIMRFYEGYHLGGNYMYC